MKERRYYAEEHKAAVFNVFTEVNEPYENDKPVGQIELAEATYIGGDLYIIPMQIYRTSHPLLLKAVCLIAEMHNDADGNTYANICSNNIRPVEISIDGMARYDNNGFRTPAVWDIRPQTKCQEEKESL